MADLAPVALPVATPVAWLGAAQTTRWMSFEGASFPAPASPLLGECTEWVGIESGPVGGKFRIVIFIVIFAINSFFFGQSHIYIAKWRRTFNNTWAPHG